MGRTARELDEELGIAVTVDEPITFAVHEEPGLCIVLLFHRARILRGEPRPREGQELAWVRPAELIGLDMPPADAALVQLLQPR